VKQHPEEASRGANSIDGRGPRLPALEIRRRHMGKVGCLSPLGIELGYREQNAEQDPQNVEKVEMVHWGRV